MHDDTLASFHIPFQSVANKSFTIHGYVFGDVDIIIKKPINQKNLKHVPEVENLAYLPGGLVSVFRYVRKLDIYRNYC
jgi:hypothetical protein